MIWGALPFGLVLWLILWIAGYCYDQWGKERRCAAHWKERATDLSGFIARQQSGRHARKCQIAQDKARTDAMTARLRKELKL